MRIEKNCPLHLCQVIKAAADTCQIGRYVSDSLVHDHGVPCCRVSSIDSEIAKGVMLHGSFPGLDLPISCSSLLIASRDRLGDCEARHIPTSAHTLDNTAQGSCLLINFAFVRARISPGHPSATFHLFESEESSAFTILSGMTQVPRVLLSQ